MDINRLVIGIDDNSVPLGILAVNNAELKGVTFFYEQDSILDWINSKQSDSIPNPILHQIFDIIKGSDLPRVHSFKEAIVIPNYAGMCLANAIDAYYVALSQRFKPHGAWPLIEKIQGYSYVMYLYTLGPDEKEEDFPVQGQQYFNCLIGYLKSEKECGVHIINSKAQFRNLLETLDCFDERIEGELLTAVSNSLLPDESSESPIELERCLAAFVFRVISYRFYIDEVADKFRKLAGVQPHQLVGEFSSN